ncbi:LysE family translocator [Fusibacter ferrireducens]|uniref:LysE family transporter n=1 Tax=Fusibacter ferrireducens TaxID=2785058 RepID=A0ABR9ZSD1_9FIRM|nr:LysE family transporter [Fusibacter ferrireducens]MBF4693374.1 LysE family transporter [Fusibacter ferrireducens]
MFNLSAFLSYVIVVTFTPGPNNIMSMANASRVGYKKTLNFILGVTTGFFLIMLFSSYFNIALSAFLPKINSYMSVIGALYMLYLALQIMGFHIKKTSHENHKDHSDASKLNSYKSGMILQFINPKVILYGITLTSNFIIPYFSSSYQLVLFSLFLAFVAFLSNSSWALFGSLFNRFLSNYEKPFNIIMGLILIYSALTLSGLWH